MCDGKASLKILVEESEERGEGPLGRSGFLYKDNIKNESEIVWDGAE